MPTLKHRLIECRYIYGASLLFVLVAMALSAIYTKPDIFLMLTAWHSKPADYFFFVVTQLGNGLFVVAVGVFLLFRKQYTAAMLVLLSYAFSGVLAQIIKYFVVEQRPYLYFKALGITLPIVEGETVYYSSSFPSGHTASAFSLVTALAMGMKQLNKYWPWLLLIAVLVAYSRMYVSNHFLIDVGVGALLGILSTIPAYWIIYRYRERKR